MNNNTNTRAVIAMLLACLAIVGVLVFGVVNSSEFTEQSERISVLEGQLAEQHTIDASYAFLPAPGGVKYFTLEVGPSICFGDANKIHYPYGTEWYVNTGENGVAMAYSTSMGDAGDKEIVTKGEWWPVAITSYPFDFCFFTEDGEVVTIALALPPPQKG